MKKHVTVMWAVTIWAAMAAAQTTNRVQAGIIQGTTINWFASNSVPYQVQWSGDQINWNNLGGPISGTGSTNTVLDTPGRSYYQVLSIQQE